MFKLNTTSQQNGSEFGREQGRQVGPKVLRQGPLKNPEQMVLCQGPAVTQELTQLRVVQDHQLESLPSCEVEADSGPHLLLGQQVQVALLLHPPVPGLKENATLLASSFKIGVSTKQKRLITRSRAPCTGATLEEVPVASATEAETGLVLAKVGRVGLGHKDLPVNDLQEPRVLTRSGPVERRVLEIPGNQWAPAFKDRGPSQSRSTHERGWLPRDQALPPRMPGLSKSSQVRWELFDPGLVQLQRRSWLDLVNRNL